MGLLEQDHAFEIADALIAAADADETEVSLDCVEDRFVRFGPEGPTQNADRERYELSVRVRYADPNGGYREAKASTGSIDEASALGALQRAQVLGRIAAATPDAVPLGGPVEVEGTAPSRPTQDHSFREKAEWIEAALDRADAAELAAGGLARTTVFSRSLVNSAGRRVHGATSRAEFSLTVADRGADAETTGGSAAARSVHRFVDQVEVERVIEDAVTAAVAGRDPEDMAPGTYPVVLAPAAVAALLAYTPGPAFGARAVHEGSSFLVEAAGERVLGEQLTIVDDPAHPWFGGLRFDGEGAPRGATPLVEAGAPTGPVTDAYWANRLGRPNTGHGARQPTADGPRPGHLTVTPGDKSLEELCAAMGDGLLVRQLHYVNLVEPRRLELTGMTRGGVFRVEGGKVKGPVKNLRFTQSLVEALADIEGVGSEPAREGSLMGGEVITPALFLKGFRFTSRAAD